METTASDVLKKLEDANKENSEKMNKAFQQLNDAFCESIGIDRLVKWIVKELDKVQ